MQPNPHQQRGGYRDGIITFATSNHSNNSEAQGGGPEYPPSVAGYGRSAIPEDLEACPCTRTTQLVLLHANRVNVLKPVETETVTARICKCYAIAAST